MMNRTIEYFQLTIEPDHWAAPRSARYFRIEVVVNGQKHTVRRELIPDDLTSLFDFHFEVSKDEIKKAIEQSS